MKKLSFTLLSSMIISLMVVSQTLMSASDIHKTKENHQRVTISTDKNNYNTIVSPTKQISLQEEQPLATLTTTTVSPGNDDDGELISELSVTFQLGAAKTNTPIMIDWGDGVARDYTINSSEPVSVSETVDLGAIIKIYGDITLLDASHTHLTAVALGNAPTLEILRLSQNKIESIDLKSAPKLKELMITDNKLSKLDISLCPKLEELYCGYNTLSEIDLKNNSKLSVLNCYNNKFTSLDVSSLTGLEIFVPSDNQLVSPLNLSKNTKLRTLDIANCGLTEVNLNSDSLRRLVAVGNKLTHLNISPKGKAKHLYHIDIRKNNFDACAINDIIVFLTSDYQNTDKTYVARLEGNPGAAYYDYSLIEANQTHIVWQVDAKGDGSGCATAKIFDNGNTELGKATLMVEGSQKPFGYAINKNKDVVIKILPNEGYEIDFVRFEQTTLYPSSTDKQTFSFAIKNSGILTYDFKVSTGIDNISDKSHTISRLGNEFTIEGFVAGTEYSLYNISGQIIKSGKILSDAKITFTLNTPGCYLLKAGNDTIKFIR